MTIAATQPEAGDVIAELLRRVSTLEQHNAEIKKALNESEKRQAASETASETKYAESEKRQTANEKETAVIDARLDAVATKSDVVNLDKKLEVGLANLGRQIAEEGKEAARRETRNTWLLVGTIIAAAAAVLAAMQMPAAG